MRVVPVVQVDLPEPSSVEDANAWACWGQSGPVPVGTPVDPVPDVYGADGEVQVDDWRLRPDDAEALAARLLAAAAWARKTY